MGQLNLLLKPLFCCPSTDRSHPNSLPAPIHTIHIATSLHCRGETGRPQAKIRSSTHCTVLRTPRSVALFLQTFAPVPSASTKWCHEHPHCRMHLYRPPTHLLCLRTYLHLSCTPSHAGRGRNVHQKHQSCSKPSSLSSTGVHIASTSTRTQRPSITERVLTRR
jgi:hypothetical protein